MRIPTVWLCPLTVRRLPVCPNSGPACHCSSASPSTGQSRVRWTRTCAWAQSSSTVAPCTFAQTLWCTRRGDLVMTATHYLVGASKITFVPGFAGDAPPTDLWTAAAIYLDPRWTATKDPHADYAIARVSSEAGGSVESHVGLALTLGTAPPRGSRVTVTRDPSGVGGSPIGCQASTSVNDSGFPSLACDGLVGGTSGAPWVSGTTLTGPDRWFRARWMRRERFLLGTVRRAHRLAAGPCRRRGSRRYRAERRRRHLLAGRDQRRNWLSARILFVTSSAATL